MSGLMCRTGTCGLVSLIQRCSRLEEFLLCESHERPGPLTLTLERCLCVNHSQMIVSAAAASDSSFLTFTDFEPMLSKQHLTQGKFDVTYQLSEFKPVTCQLCEGPTSQCQTTPPCQHRWTLTPKQNKYSDIKKH